MPATMVQVDYAETNAKIEDCKRVQNEVLEGARNEDRDLSEQEWAIYNRKSEQIAQLNQRAEYHRTNLKQLELAEERTAELAELQTRARRNDPVDYEYRSAGQYMADVYGAWRGDRDSRERLDMFNRVAAHTITSDVPGLIPTPIEQPVVNFVDQSRPLCTAIGMKPVPQYPTFTRPIVTQHVQVGKQTAEKTELVSRKFTVGKQTVTVDPYGGYGNVSRELIDWSQPAALDSIIADFAGEYAATTEDVFCDALMTAATAGPVLPTGINTVAQISAAIWTAAGTAYAATKTSGRLVIGVSPDQLGIVGPLFPSVNPQNAVSSGFAAGDFGSGVMGQIGNIPVVMSNGLNTGSMVVVSTPAVEIYDQRGGVLQAVEPSVLGLQVGYYGYFGWWIAAAAGVVKITKTP